MNEIGTLALANPLWLWLAVAAVLLGIELATGSGWLLWPAAAAVIVAVGGPLSGLSAAGLVLLFAVLTTILTLIGRRVISRQAGTLQPDINDPVHRLGGRSGVTAGDFVAGTGRVVVEGTEWPARTADGSSPVAGQLVRVEGVTDGVLRIQSQD